MYNYRTELDYYNYENNNYNKPMYTKMKIQICCMIHIMDL